MVERYAIFANERGARFTVPLGHSVAVRCQQEPWVDRLRSSERGEHVQHRFAGGSKEAGLAGETGTGAGLGAVAVLRDQIISGFVSYSGGLGQGEEG